MQAELQEICTLLIMMLSLQTKKAEDSLEMRESSADFSDRPLRLLEDGLHALVGHVAVKLRDRFIRCVHRQHRNARIERVDVALGHELGDRAAAAGVGLAELGHLPEHAVVVHQLAHLADNLGAGVARAALAAGAGVLAQRHAVVAERGVALIVNIGKVRVVGRRHVRAQAEGVGKAVGQLHALRAAHIAHEPFKGLREHTGNTLRADLFLIGKDADGGLLGRNGVENACKLCVGADAVVVTVGSDEAAVKADVARLAGGHDLELGGDEVLLRNAVLRVQILENAELETVGAVLIFKRLSAEQYVQALARDGLVKGLFALLAAEVREKVVDDELRVAFLAADVHGNARTVAQHNNTVQLEGDGHPLILADAAVVMGLEVGHLALFIERAGLHVEARGVGMGRADIRAVAQVLAADDGEHDALAAVVEVDLVAGGKLHARLVGLEASLLCQLDAVLHAKALGLAVVEEVLVILAVGIHRLLVLRAQTVIAVLGRVEEFFRQLVLLTHVSFPP